MNKEKWKFTIRVYTPGEVFHERRSFYYHRKNGDRFLQLYFFGWGIMFGWSKWSTGTPFFMIVGRKDNEI